jgi:hypothetical protein
MSKAYRLNVLIISHKRNCVCVCACLHVHACIREQAQAVKVIHSLFCVVTGLGVGSLKLMQLN